MCNLLKTNHLKIFLTVISLILISCSQKRESKSKDLERILIGTWELDSISTNSGKFAHSNINDSKTLTFYNNTDYSYEWNNGDVGNTFFGKYFILENPKRGLKTITLIPDIQLSGKDTIRIEYMNFDIVHASAKMLQVVDQTEFIKRDSLPYKVYNKNSIYKRVK
jgi:hypothetical protein